MGENGWLLIKHNDDFASKTDITKKDKSILSGKTIEAMEKTSEKVWQHGHEEDVEKSTKKLKKAPAEPAEEVVGEDLAEGQVDKDQPDVAALLKSAPKSAAPKNIKPMKATPVDEPFDDPDWVYEVKWDGYRAVAVIDKKGAELISRNNLPFDKYYPINKILKDWQINAVIDGEIVVLNDKGLSDFGALQNWRSEADGNPGLLRI
nr:hypothetical protein [Mucilaginibacter humi]